MASWPVVPQSARGSCQTSPKLQLCPTPHLKGTRAKDPAKPSSWPHTPWHCSQHSVLGTLSYEYALLHDLGCPSGDSCLRLPPCTRTAIHGFRSLHCWGCTQSVCGEVGLDSQAKPAGSLSLLTCQCMVASLVCVSRDGVHVRVLKLDISVTPQGILLSASDERVKCPLCGAKCPLSHRQSDLMCALSVQSCASHPVIWATGCPGSSLWTVGRDVLDWVYGSRAGHHWGGVWLAAAIVGNLC